MNATTTKTAAPNGRQRRRSPRLNPRLVENLRDHEDEVDDDESVASSKTKTVEDENDPDSIQQSMTNLDDEDEKEVYYFEGVEYATYQDMVDAKRRRNQERLQQSGLLQVVDNLRSSPSSLDNNSNRRSTTTSKGLKATKRNKSGRRDSNDSAKRRKSNRLAGIQSDGLYVDDERAGRFTVKSDASTPQNTNGSGIAAVSPGSNVSTERNTDPWYESWQQGRPMDIEQAIRATGPKWCPEDQASQKIQKAQQFVVDGPLSASSSSSKDPMEEQRTSTTSSIIGTMVSSLSVNDIERCVAKVCPERIYSVAVHPSRTNLLVAAGDKQGHVGLWNVDAPAPNDDEEDGVVLFKPHRGSVSCLAWTGPIHLISTSYDGTIRNFDIEKQQWIQEFNVRSSLSSEEEDVDANFWLQYACVDSNPQYCFWASTSIGTILRIDSRCDPSQRITGQVQASEKKINTISLHPNGYSLVSAGLDCTVKLWDARHLPTRKSSSVAVPISHYNGGRSVNSAFFSPSGEYVVSTTMANKLDLFQNFHLHTASSSSTKQQKPSIVRPYHSIRHDNMTGRWLTTFQAVFHPGLNIFGIGSMRKPRAVEIFDPSAATRDDGLVRAISGNALTAVASRLAFHPRTDRIVLAGGNSSGRVTIIR